jgi:hypothetical protein
MFSNNDTDDGFNWEDMMKDPSKFMQQLVGANSNLPMPEFITMDEIRTRAKTLVAEVFSHWEELHVIVGAYEETIRKRWLKKTAAQRTAILRTVYPKIPERHRPGEGDNRAEACFPQSQSLSGLVSSTPAKRGGLGQTQESASSYACTWKEQARRVRVDGSDEPTSGTHITSDHSAIHIERHNVFDWSEGRSVVRPNLYMGGKGGCFR